MDKNQIRDIAEKIIDTIENLIPQYCAIQEDKSIANGNVAVCIIDKDGQIFGRMWGDKQSEYVNPTMLPGKKQARYG